MMKRIARMLRKLADLFDPRIAPSGPGIVLRISCDPSAFTDGINRAQERLRAFREEVEAVDEMASNIERSYRP